MTVVTVTPPALSFKALHHGLVHHCATLDDCAQQLADGLLGEYEVRIVARRTLTSDRELTVDEATRVVQLATPLAAKARAA